MKFIQWLKEQIEWLKSFFMELEIGDIKPKASSTKLMKFLIVVVFLRGYFVATWNSGHIEDIPSNWIIVLLGVVSAGTLDKYFTWRLGNGNGSK